MILLNLYTYVWILYLQLFHTLATKISHVFFQLFLNDFCHEDVQETYAQEKDIFNTKAMVFEEKDI
jgi:hypothetical protein